MIDYAIAHGVNYFDTAPVYGESEVVTGKALSRHPRDSYKIATKMSNMEQLKENVSLFTGFEPFDQKEMDFMQTVADLYKSNIHIPCTACSYCMPCPHGVNIPGNFRAFNTASDQLNIPDPDKKGKDFGKKKKAFLKLYDELPAAAKADACIGCNACLPKCPQHIRIPEQMKMISELVAKL